MEDLIKREDAIELVALCGTKPIAPWTFDELQEEIQNLPSAEPEQGEWERIPYSMADYGSRCSLCHFKVGNPTNFCPNCGADMRGEK